MHAAQYCHNNCHGPVQMETVPVNSNSGGSNESYYDDAEGGYMADLETDPLNTSGAGRSSNGRAMIWRILLIIQIVAVFIFTCFSIYSVVAGNTDAVRAACPRLWQYMLARTLCGVLVGALVLLGHYYLFGQQQPQYQWASLSRGCSPWNMMLVFWALMFCYFCVFFVAGMTTMPGLLSDDAAGHLCSDTLSNTVVTGSPLLAYLGWVSFVCDGLVSGVILVLVIYLFAMTPNFFSA